MQLHLFYVVSVLDVVAHFGVRVAVTCLRGRLVLLVCHAFHALQRDLGIALERRVLRRGRMAVLGGVLFVRQDYGTSGTGHAVLGLVTARASRSEWHPGNTRMNKASRSVKKFIDKLYVRTESREIVNSENVEARGRVIDIFV